MEQEGKMTEQNGLERSSATEELRRLLDERGVEWRRTPHYSSESQDNETVFAGDGIEWYANDHLNGRLGLRALRYEVTPEQAVAATLGRGMLTADDVRDSIERHSDASGGNGRDFHNGAYVAIADELNATLGRGTCKNMDSDTDAEWFPCSECNTELRVHEPFDAFSIHYCPNCGRRVVE